ncbi:hypothetical protein [Verrucosispora sp. WMMC514]|uniref:hypothetical protein n=1 Tax=Verrucosispora sp. WMMC514 TaxID=3015156 RepID=UPI00248CF773|nr:hypothetical protein [Verrucosispora sp. WMMC514]WBB91414.1 hypothetical protein O7597_31405 [Verrucosispora sp. WMMC514]
MVKALAGSILRATPSGDVDPVVGVLLDWVRAHPDEGTAAQVLAACLSAGTSMDLRQQKVAYLVEWLAVPRPGWTRVFLAAQSVLTTEQRSALALPWLLERVDKRYWLRVFYVTADQFDPAQLAAVVRHWFATAAAGNFAAGPLWRAAIENDGPCAHLLDDPSFRRDVVDWLGRSGGVAAWRPIALSLVLRDPDAEVLRAVVQSQAPLGRRYSLANDLEDHLRTQREQAEKVCRIMEQLDHTDTWHILWRRLVSVAPSERTWAVSQRLLMDDEDGGHAPRLWIRLWDVCPDPQREWLAHLAEQRLTSCPSDEPAWQEVRKKLLNPVEPDCGKRDAHAQLLTPLTERPAELVECLAECSHCRHPFEITTQKKIFQYVCPKCDFDLTIDTDLAEVITARPMTRVVGHLVDVSNKGARMLCDRCGNERTETMRLDSHHIAVDRQCGLLHVVPAAEVTDFREHRRHRAAGLSDDDG